MDLAMGRVEVNVFNAVGQLLYNKEYKDASDLRTINLSDQSEGIYLLQLTLEDQIVTRRLIKH